MNSNVMRRVATVLGIMAAVIFLTPRSTYALEYKVAPVDHGGSLKGKVYFKGDYPKGKPTAVTQDPKICGSEQPYEEFMVSPKNKGLRNVVVRITGISKGKPFPKGEAEVEQKHCRYSPHVQVVRLGRIKIVNRDPTLHNVHAYRDPEGKRKSLFNLAQPTKGNVLKKRFRKTGVVQLVCDVHHWMKGWIVVVDNPYYALTAQDGRFAINNIPPGNYQLEIWHEGLGAVKKSVTIKADQTTPLDVPLGE